MYCIYFGKITFEIVISIVLLTKKFENVSYSSYEEFLSSNETPTSVIVFSENNEENLAKIKKINAEKIHLFSKETIVNDLETEKIMAINCEKKSFFRKICDVYEFKFPNTEIKTLFLRLEKYIANGSDEIAIGIEKTVMKETFIGEKIRIFNSIYNGYLSNPRSLNDKYLAMGKRELESLEKNKKDASRLEIYKNLMNGDGFFDYYSRDTHFYFLEVPKDITIDDFAKINSLFVSEFLEKGVVVVFKPKNNNYYAKITSSPFNGDDLFEIFARPQKNQKVIQIKGGEFSPDCSADKDMCFSASALVSDFDIFFPNDDE